MKKIDEVASQLAKLDDPEEFEEGQYFADFLETLIFLEGRKGSGKTTSAVALAHKIGYYFDRTTLSDVALDSKEFGQTWHLLDEKTFLSQLMKISEVAKNTDQEEVDFAVSWALKNMGITLEGATIILDEAYKYFDCRTPSDKLVRVFGYFIAQMRHYRNTVIILAPRKDYLDKRVRLQIDWEGRVATNQETGIIYTRFRSYQTGEIKRLRLWGENYWSMFDSWSPIAMRRKVLEMRTD